MVLKLAVRNIAKYRRRTLLCGIILGFGALLATLSSSLIETTTKSLRERYVDTFTADAIISAEAYPPPSLAPRMGGGSAGPAANPEIPRYEELAAFVTAHPAVRSVSPQLQTSAEASLKPDAAGGSSGQAARMVIMGIDPEAHAATFAAPWEMISGEPPSEGIDGLWISEQRLQGLSMNLGGRTIEPGDELVVSCQTLYAGVKIRVIPLRGVYRLAKADPQLSSVVYADARSVQLLLGIAGGIAPIPDTASLGASSPESSFESDELLVEEAPISVEEPGLWSPERLVQFVNEVPPSQAGGAIAPRFHFLLVRLDRESAYASFARDLEAFAAERGIALRVADWSAGTGVFGSMVQSIRTVFSFLLLAVILVSLFIVTNSVVISVAERIAEIGTLRALGGQRSFIRGIILAETLLTALLFGTAGSALALAIAGVANAMRAPVAGALLQGILGGETLRLALQAKSPLLSLGIVAATGAVAALYPVMLAVGIRPVQAMSQR